MFSIATPWIFALLPLPLLVKWLLPAQASNENLALRVPFFAKLASVNEHNRYGHSVYKESVLWLIWLLLLCAASGPRWIGEAIELPQQGRDIMFALDLSGSMHVPDMVVDGEQVDRLVAVKKVAKQFVQDRKGDRVGLILFGSRAYLQTPLTFDRQTVLDMLDDATIGLAGQQTAIGDAIGLAIKRLQQQPKDSRVLVLLTDGANNSGTASPMAAARLAAEENITIYTIGLGAEELVIPGFFGSHTINPSEDIDEQALQDIADITGGMYFRARDTKALQQIYKTINKLEPISEQSLQYRPIKALYYWPLAAALLLSLAMALTRIALRRWQYGKVQQTVLQGGD